MTTPNLNTPLPPSDTDPAMGWPEAVVTVVIIAAMVALIMAGVLSASALTLALPIPLSRK